MFMQIQGNLFCYLPDEIFEKILKKSGDDNLYKLKITSKKINRTIQDKKNELFSQQTLEKLITYHNIIVLFGGIDSYYSIPYYYTGAIRGYCGFYQVYHSFYRYKKEEKEYLRIFKYKGDNLSSEEISSRDIFLGNQNSVKEVKDSIVGTSRLIPLFDSSCTIL
jgi:hypothetical protein